MTNTPRATNDENTCYFCNSSAILRSKKRRRVNFLTLRDYFQCAECGGYSLFPKLETNEIETLYSVNYIQEVNLEVQPNPEFTVDRFVNLAETLSIISDKSKKNFLDYGCGATAEVVLLAASQGFRSYGVEIEEGTREEARLKSNCSIYSPDELLSSGIRFDLIFLGDVLEHLSHPLDILHQMHEVLLPNGHLIIQGPLEGAPTLSNFLLSVKARLLYKSPSDFPPYHVSLATKESIIRAVKLSNLKIERFVITEPMWPAPRLGSRATLTSLTSLIFSLAKLVDILLSKIIPRYGTRFFLIATKS